MVLMLPGAAGSSTLTFNNQMRSATFANNQFFKNANILNTIEQNRIWLDLINANGLASRTLVGYVTDATNDEDRLFDMFSSNKSSQNFYSLINQNPMLIQGKALPFDVNDSIAMGIKTANDGIFTIAIASADGIFQNGNQTVFLEDKLLNVLHNLTAAPYQFTTIKGIVNNRFLIRYSQNVISDNSDNQINVYVNNDINIKSTNELIKNVTVYDILGRTLLDLKNISKKEVLLSTLRPTGNIVIVKTMLQNDTETTKKIIF